MTAYLPLTRHRGSRLSRSSATPSGSPTQTSALSVLRAICQCIAVVNTAEANSPETQQADGSIEWSKRRCERGSVWPTNIARKLPIIEISLEDDQRRLLKFLKELFRSLRYDCKVQRVCPVLIRTIF